MRFFAYSSASARSSPVICRSLAIRKVLWMGSGHTLALPWHPPTLAVRDPFHCFAEDVNTTQEQQVGHLRNHSRVEQSPPYRSSPSPRRIFRCCSTSRSVAQSMMGSLDELVSKESTRISQCQLYSASQHHPLELLITTIFAVLTAVSQYRVTPHGP